MKISIKNLRKIIRESIDEMKMSEAMHDVHYEDEELNSEELDSKLDNLIDGLEPNEDEEGDVIRSDIKNQGKRILDRIKL